MKRHKRKISIILLITFAINFIFPLIETSALYSSDLTPSDCTSYEMGIANPDGTITPKSCYNTYEEAETAMKQESDDNAIVINRRTKKILNAKYALVDLNRGDVVTNYYENWDSTSSKTYMNNSSAYNGVDGAFIDYTNMNGRVKVMISNFTGWIDSGTYNIIPLSWVKSKSFYSVGNGTTDNNIWHCYAKDITQTLARPTCRGFGPKPEQLPEGNYYSYDGIYFYTDQKTMLNDYKANTREHATNKDNPYYNYYMYLPHHTKTTYSSQNIDEYIRNLGFVGTIYGSYAFNNYSMLYGQGTFFYNAQEKYGVNAALMFGLSQNESGNGRSNISIDRNNGFGHNAVDSDPYGSSSGYATYAHGIYSHAYKWISFGYANANDWRFHGSVLGSKGLGANMQYASDPYWGEKAASLYYDFDAANGFYDYNYYQLAVTNTQTLSVRKEPNTSSPVMYTYKELNTPVVIIEEVQGESVNGNQTWYKIMSDLELDSNRNIMNYQDNNRQEYDWEQNYVYVSAYYMKKINTAKNGIKKPTDTYSYEDQKYTYNIYTKDGKASPKVAITTKSAPLYYDSTLKSSRGITLSKDRYTMVHAEVKDINGNIVSYLVTSDYNKNQKEWVSSSAITFKEKSIGYADFDKRAIYQNVYTSPNGTVVGSIYDKTYLPLLDTQVINGTTWLKIPYNLTGSTNTTGWVKASDTDYRMLYTEVVTYKPEIIASDKQIPLNSTFNELEGVKATDKEDGDLTSKIKVTTNTVNTKKTGVYSVTYSVTDSDNNTVTKTITVTVKDYEPKSGLFYYQSFVNKTANKFEVSGFLGVAGMDNTKNDNITHTLIFQNVDTKEEIKYNLARWTESYPFEMDNMNDDKPYNYNGGWFKDTIDLSTLKKGDYIIYIEVTNGIYKARELFNNVFNQEMTKKLEVNNRSYRLEMNYYKREMPLELFVRDENLISKRNTPTSEAMFNFYEELKLQDKYLYIKGTSYSYQLDYNSNKNITRTIILENTSNFTRTIFNNIGSITTGDYEIVQRVNDGKDKTRAWYDNKIDLSALEKGTYAVIIKTGVDGIEDDGELRNLMDTSINQSIILNGKKISLKINTEKRSRIEIIVE